jgi:hypothetical protein
VVARELNQAHGKDSRTMREEREMGPRMNTNEQNKHESKRMF